MSEHNIHSDDEIELKKETAGIDDSVTGINELGSNEAEGNEFYVAIDFCSTGTNVYHSFRRLRYG